MILELSCKINMELKRDLLSVTYLSLAPLKSYLIVSMMFELGVVVSNAGTGHQEC